MGFIIDAVSVTLTVAETALFFGALHGFETCFELARFGPNWTRFSQNLVKVKSVSKRGRYQRDKDEESPPGGH